MTDFEDDTDPPSLEQASADLQPSPAVTFGEGGFTPTGMPPGNPKHVSEGEADLRKAEIAKLGQAEACRRAWARATEAKAKRHGGVSPPKPKAKAEAPRKPVNFSDVSGPAKPIAKGKSKADLEKWSRNVQFAHAMLAMKLQRADFAIDEQEALLLTEAVTDVLEYYNIKLKGQAGAWASLVYAVGMVYGPRVGVLIIERMQSAKAPAPVAQPNSNWAGQAG